MTTSKRRKGKGGKRAGNALPSKGHHCRVAVHLDAMVMAPNAARNQESDLREQDYNIDRSQDVSDCSPCRKKGNHEHNANIVHS